MSAQEYALLDRVIIKPLVIQGIECWAMKQSRLVKRGGHPPPVLSDLRDSGKIEQDADKIAFLWRSDDGHRLSLEKNRLGPTGTIPLAVNFEVGVISEAEEHR